MNGPALLCAVTFCLLVNAAVVLWVKRRDRPDSRPEKNATPGIALKVGLRQAEAELIFKINGMMSGRERLPSIEPE